MGEDDFPQYGQGAEITTDIEDVEIEYEDDDE